MGFRLYPIFIKCQNSLYSDEDILNMIGLSNFKKTKTVGFYQTSKQEKDIFIGTKENGKILCNRELAYGAFEENNIFLQFKDCEVVSIIWDETSRIFGFSFIQNGEVIRKVLRKGNEISYNFGNPVQEELDIEEETLFEQDEIEEMVEFEGMEEFKKIVKAEIICRATSRFTKRYIEPELLNIKGKIEMNKYE